MNRFTVSIFLSIPLASAATTSFDKAVQPVFGKSCSGCHNEKLASGGLNLAAFADPVSLTSKREGWERILAKLRAGEMPPKGVPRPPAEQVDALIRYVDGSFDRADKLTKPDPGRVIAHRLNRSEYSNTIRDLLGVAFHADEEFPTDDTGYGFDNIATVLSVSPTLMQKYMQAAEQIASRAVGGDPLPKPGMFVKRTQLRRFNTSTVEFRHRVDFDADYLVRVRMVGHRGDKDPPVNVMLSVDGKPVKTQSVSTQINDVNRQSGETHRTFVEARAFVTQGDHVFRSEFVNDEGIKDIPQNERMSNRRNIYPDTMEIAGPFPSAEPHPAQKKILTCDPSSGPVCVSKILSELSRKAYRGNATKADVGELIQTFDRAKAGGYTAPQSLQFAIAAMLVSPQFLFRIERDPKPGAVARISDLELASRLSYFLWSSMPDDELLQLAESNRLHRPAALAAQVKRLIADPRASAFADNFTGQWLEIRSLDALQPDAKKFPEWSPELREAMRTETRMFFEAVLRENRPISDFLDAKYSFLNETLAKYYGIEGVTGAEFRRVDLTGDQRSGVLTHGSVLRVTSYPNRTSVVLRGKYLLENILGSLPPPPPPDIPALDEAAIGVANSLREQMEQHRSDPVCASCHSKMDVLGFGLENYDAIGRWRTADGKFPVEPGGTFPNGKSFTGPAEMKTLLRDNIPEVARALAEKMLTYAVGRGIEPFDRRTVKGLVRQTALQNYKFQSLVMGIVNSAPFQRRRGEEKAEPMKEIASK